MHPNQRELWRAEPQAAPRICQQLSTGQRTRLISHLAFLMLKRVRQQATAKPPPTPSKTYER
jgi:hypothetical protein